jgi:hypothetical protein
MRKRMFFILMTTVTLCRLNAQDSLYYSILWKPKPLQREAKILQEKVYEYNYHNDTITDSGLLEIKFFDPSGQISKRQLFKNNQQVSEITNYYTGFVLDSSVVVQSVPDGITLRKYRYDSSGRLSMIITKKHQEPAVYEQYIYNSLNQPQQIVSKRRWKRICFHTIRVQV